MTKEELRAHCEKQVKMCEEWAKGNDREPSGKIYEEHKLILDLINELQDKSYELWKESYEEEHLRNIRLEEKIKALEQQSSDDCIARQPLIDNWNSCADMLMDEGDSAIVMDWIFDAPPVTPTHKVGKWIRVGSGNLIDDFRCECCNKQPSLKKVGYTWGWDFTDYCPNCGAEMRGEGDE